MSCTSEFRSERPFVSIESVTSTNPINHTPPGVKSPLSNQRPLVPSFSKNLSLLLNYVVHCRLLRPSSIGLIDRWSW